jgi:hypothetical protein
MVSRRRRNNNSDAVAAAAATCTLYTPEEFGPALVVMGQLWSVFLAAEGVEVLRT